MESQPQNPEFRNNPENFHPCAYTYVIPIICMCSYPAEQIFGLNLHMIL